MCRLSIAIDRSVHTLEPVFDVLDATSFHIRSIRLVPVAFSSKADVYVSLGGGSKIELSAVLERLAKLPAVRSTDHSLPEIWASEG